MVKAWLLSPDTRALEAVEFSRQGAVVSPNDGRYLPLAVMDGVAVADFVLARTLILGGDVESPLISVYIIHQSPSSRYALFVGPDAELGFRVQPSASAELSQFFSGRAVLVKLATYRLELHGEGAYDAPELKSMDNTPVVKWMARPDGPVEYDWFAWSKVGTNLVIRPHPKFCAHCGRREMVLKVCGRCKQGLYCSRECQAGHWREHKTSCKDPM